MIRGLAKGAMLAAFGRINASTRMYRTVTREWMGSQATHVDKLQRVWPGYVDVWRSCPTIDVEGAEVWIYEGGWTPFPFFANHLVTGKAGVVTNRFARMLDRYLARAVNGAIACDMPGDLPLGARRADLEPLRWASTVVEAIETIGGRLHEAVDPRCIPLTSESIDLCHSGGTLEHHSPDDLRLFLREAERILRPGGEMSHVVDHRDHLHHADPTWPFLSHLALSTRTYAMLCGHPLLYHNRLLAPQVEALFEDSGFERIAVRRLVLPSGVYVDNENDALSGDPGIERRKLASPFRTASDADLRTAAAHYLYRKPT